MNVTVSLGPQLLSLANLRTRSITLSVFWDELCESVATLYGDLPILYPVFLRGIRGFIVRL